MNCYDGNFSSIEIEKMEKLIEEFENSPVDEQEEQFFEELVRKIDRRHREAFMRKIDQPSQFTIIWDKFKSNWLKIIACGIAGAAIFMFVGWCFGI
jgi:hypothetical protein